MKRKLLQVMKYFSLCLSVYSGDIKSEESFYITLNEAKTKMLDYLFIENISGGINQFYLKEYNKMVYEWVQEELEKYKRS